MTGSRTLEARVESRPSDPYLFAAHDAVNVVVLIFFHISRGRREPVLAAA